MRCKTLNEIIHITAQKSTTAKTNFGCTVAEDNYYKSQVTNDNVVRIVVDQPSEILINTNDYVVVTP